MNTEDLRKEYYQVMGYNQPFGNEHHEEIFKWFIEKIEIERCSLNKEITDKDILLSKKTSELNEIRYSDHNILTINNVKQEVAEDHGFTNWNHLVDYLCHSNEQKLLNIYIDELAIMYADAKIYQELELPSLTYHSCEHCGCHCECSDQPCSCCPQKP